MSDLVKYKPVFGVSIVTARIQASVTQNTNSVCLLRSEKKKEKTSKPVLACIVKKNS